ncbi:hypothetical protein Tco_0527176 [Tanacetum coccineum]
MEGLPRCVESQWSANSLRWEEAMILYCCRSIVKDCRLARETDRLYRDVVAVVEERAQFLQELDTLPGRLMLEKMAEFLRDTQRKDTERML